MKRECNGQMPKPDWGKYQFARLGAIPIKQAKVSGKGDQIARKHSDPTLHPQPHTNVEAHLGSYNRSCSDSKRWGVSTTRVNSGCLQLGRRSVLPLRNNNLVATRNGVATETIHTKDICQESANLRTSCSQSGFKSANSNKEGTSKPEELRIASVRVSLAG